MEEGWLSPGGGRGFFGRDGSDESWINGFRGAARTGKRVAKESCPIVACNSKREEEKNSNKPCLTPFMVDKPAWQKNGKQGYLTELCIQMAMVKSLALQCAGYVDPVTLRNIT
jgi:hypothetical protein